MRPYRLISTTNKVHFYLLNKFLRKKSNIFSMSNQVFSYFCKKHFCMKRLILTIVGVVMLAFFLGCEKEPIIMTPMRRMYTESMTLHEFSLDSIANFTKKFNFFVTMNPSSRDDEFFDPTLKNLRHAASLHGYTVVDDKTSIYISGSE